jgi:hypothetical protein
MYKTMKLINEEGGRLQFVSQNPNIPALNLSDLKWNGKLYSKLVHEYEQRVGRKLIYFYKSKHA